MPTKHRKSQRKSEPAGTAVESRSYQFPDGLRNLYASVTALVDTIGTPVMVLDLEGRVLHYSDACRSHLSDFDPLPKNRVLWEAIPWTRGADDLRQLFRGRKNIPAGEEIELAYENAENVEHLFRCSFQPVPTAPGTPALMVATGRDITERIRANQQLQTASEALKAEHSIVESKNIALKEVMNQIDEQKAEIGRHVQANVNRVVLPMLRTLNGKLNQEDRHLAKLLENALQELLDPVVSKLEQLSSRLSPREIEVCNMIRNGFTSKQIASVLCVSVHTVHNQRRSIRRKLQIKGQQANLETFLKNL